jgi:tetratricopeptide (TPR) repeat protein
MKAESRSERRSFDKASLIKTAALALALGVATWLIAPRLLPERLPPGYPTLPDLSALNSSARDLLKSADRDARRHPESVEAMGKLGMAYHANLLLEPAASAYRIAQRLAPADYRWVYCLAYLEEENGNQTEQLRLLDRTLSLNSGHAPSLLKLADAYFKLDRLDEAQRYYQLASQAPGGSASLQAGFGLSRVAARRRDWIKVIQYAAPLTHAYPSLQPPYELLKEAYDALGQRAKAGEVRQSIQLCKVKVVPPLEDPLNDQLTSLSYSSTRLLKQAGMLSHLGYPDRAVEVARRAAQAEPNDADARNFIASTLLSAYPGTPAAVDEALAQLGECLRLRPADPVPLWLFAQTFFDAPKSTAAVDRLAALMRPYAGRSEAHLYLGMLASARGDSSGAISEYMDALKNDPNNSGIYDNLGLAVEKASRLDEAAGYFQKAVQLNPMNATARYNLGRLLLQRGNDAQAMKELREALQLKPDHAGAHFCMGFAFMNLRKFDEAIPRFREGLRYSPADAEAHYGLGFSLAVQHKPEEALAEVREALRLRPDYPEAQQLFQQLGR